MDDLNNLKAGGVKPTQGDARCITHGHLIRMAIWSLRKKWNKKAASAERIAAVAKWLRDFGGWPEVESHLGDPFGRHLDAPLFAVRESEIQYGAKCDDVSF
jgi:putative DNA methylase